MLKGEWGKSIWKNFGQSCGLFGSKLGLFGDGKRQMVWSAANVKSDEASCVGSLACSFVMTRKRRLSGSSVLGTTSMTSFSSIDDAKPTA